MIYGSSLLQRTIAKKYNRIHILFQFHYTLNNKRYSVIALCSRYRADYVSANVFFSQARMLAGSIFDTADVDAVMAFTLMGNYTNATLEIPLSAHYANLAWNILKMIPPGACDERLRYQCHSTVVMADENMTGPQKKEISFY